MWIDTILLGLELGSGRCLNRIDAVESGFQDAGRLELLEFKSSKVKCRECT